MKIDKYEIKKISAELTALIEHANEATFKYEGLQLSLGNCRFDQDVATFKLEVKIKGAKSQSEKAIAICAEYFCLDVSKIAKEQGKSFALIGYNYKASKYPFELQDLATGKEYKISLEHAQSLFAKAVQNAPSRGKQIETHKQENCECGLDERGHWSEIVFDRFGCDCDETESE